jgi:hypothetical protein
MNRILLIASSLVALAAFWAVQANACDFSLNVRQSYVAPIVAKQVSHGYQQAYAAPIVLPQIQYAPQQAEYLVLPQKVEIVRPQVTLRLQQAVGYSYAAPLVQKQQVYQQQYAQPFVQKQRFAAPQKIIVQQQRSPGGILGRIQENIQARVAGRQQFRQQQALQRGSFRLSLGH